MNRTKIDSQIRQWNLVRTCHNTDFDWDALFDYQSWWIAFFCQRIEWHQVDIGTDKLGIVDEKTIGGSRQEIC